MTGKAVYDRGAVSLRNVTIGAGQLNAGASADIAQNGALSGRIVADVKVASQTAARDAEPRRHGEGAPGQELGKL